MKSRGIEQVVAAALTAGYSISVGDGNKTSIEQSRDKGEILPKVLSAGETWLLIYKKGRAFGYFRVPPQRAGRKKAPKAARLTGTL
ncbi:hypothetical protein EN816_02950 [Mesorhizobium sp. M8A.F.Ca.ET.173.01.1.1]|nr:hypothetical protein EN816_02950 [Mesorhizobium sp. M8A.F.Ca.ET.173.01.1.1]